MTPPTLETVFLAAMAESKRKTYIARVQRYSDALHRDLELAATSRNHRSRYERRARNHAAKLCRAMKSLKELDAHDASSRPAVRCVRGGKAPITLFIDGQAVQYRHA